MTELLSIILAAGEGTRMRSATPKVLHPVGGMPIIGHVARAAREAGSTQIALVTGPKHDAIRKAVTALHPDVAHFEQTVAKGTAHAASMARDLFSTAKGYVAVVYGDHPLLRGINFRAVLDRLDAGLDVAILGFEPKDPSGYGRFITDGDTLLAIREHKDATEDERRIRLCNACILAFRAEVFRDLIDKVETNNAQGEYYLGDLVGLANSAGKRVGYGLAPENDVMGVNDRSQLARAEGLFQDQRGAVDHGRLVTESFGRSHVPGQADHGHDPVQRAQVLLQGGQAVEHRGGARFLALLDGELAAQLAADGEDAIAGGRLARRENEVSHLADRDVVGHRDGWGRQFEADAVGRDIRHVQDAPSHGLPGHYGP